MKTMKNNGSLLCAALLLTGPLAGTGPAWGQEDDLPSIETLLGDIPTAESLFQDYPPISDVVKATLDHMPKSLKKSPDWVNQKKLAAFLPILRLTFAEKERNQDRTRLERDQSRENRLYGIDLDDAVVELDELLVSLSWDLSEFVFHQDQLDAVSTQIEVLEFKNKLSEQVIDAYMEHKSALLLVKQSRSLKPDARIKEELKAEQYKAV
ncbi:MAG: hypothetical protein AAF492_01380, partial [Verrucomicrobiota bacterium]